MIYGYNRRTVDKEYGLEEMREVTIAASPDILRALAAFLRSVSDELEVNTVSVNWHRHIDDEIRRALGCDFIVVSDNPTSNDALPFCNEGPD